jgi:hypothetical protein
MNVEFISAFYGTFIQRKGSEPAKLTQIPV